MNCIKGQTWGGGLLFFCNWCGDDKVRCDNPSGSRPNFFGRQHLTFDKGGKFSARQGIVRFLEGLVRQVRD